jgi:tetratricopeptide (TPR) repeat protein
MVTRLRVISLIILISLAIYANSFFNPFLWDDISLIVQNPLIKNISGISKIFSTDLFHFSYEKGNYYRPLQTLSYMFDYSIWRLRPLGYHLTNVILHALAAYLIYLLLKLISKNKMASLLAAIFFLIHPVHTEAVTYISGRADSLVTIFILSSLLCYIKRKTILSISFFIAGLLSKENAVTLPFLIILYDAYFSDFGTGKKRNYLPYFTLLVLYAFLRTSVLNFSNRPVLNIQGDFFLKLATSLKSVLIYLGLILFPVNLHMGRTLPVLNSVFNAGVITTVIVLSLLIIAVVRLRKRQRLVSFGVAWFLLTLIPVLGVFMPSKNIVMAEHWLYLPSIGFFMALGVIFGKFIELNRKTAFISASALLIPLIFLTIRQNATWKDPVNFYKRIIHYSPESTKAHFNLAAVYENNQDYDKAIQEYKRTKEIDPGYFWIHNNLGNIYTAKGLYGSAAEEYKQSIKSEPDHFLTYNNMGNLYALRQDYEQAIAQYKKSIELNPYYSESHNNLGLVYLAQDNLKESETEFHEALKLDPDNAQAHNNLGNLYVKKGLLDEAIIQYKRAIKLKPEFDKPHFNLGVIYFEKNLKEQARAEWERVLEISPKHEGALKNIKALNQRN